MAQDEGIVAPGQAVRDGTYHVHCLRQKIHLRVGGGGEDDVIGQGEEEAEAVCLPHPPSTSPSPSPSLSLLLRWLRASLGKPPEGSRPTMQLDVVDVEEEICFGIAMAEACEVAEFWVLGVGSDEGGEEVRGLTPGEVLFGSQALLHRSHAGREDQQLEGLFVCVRSCVWCVCDQTTSNLNTIFKMFPP